MSRVITMRCPHCLSRATARTSTELSTLYREITFTCRNHNCGHVFVSGLEVVRTLSPSAMPNPDVRIPLSLHIRRQELAAQLALPLAQEA